MPAEGQIVKKGETLVRFDSEDLELQKSVSKIQRLILIEQKLSMKKSNKYQRIRRYCMFI